MSLPELSLHPLVIPAAAAIYGALHSLTASNNFKQLVSKIPGLIRYYRLLYSFFAFISLLPLAALVLLIPDQHLYTIPRPFVYITILVQFVALVLLIYSLLQTDALQFIGLSQVIGIQAREKLNIKGLYRYVRHPLYACSLLIIWLTPEMTRNLLWLFISLTVYMVIGALLEERKLQTTFGQAYTDYRNVTPFLVPFVIPKNQLSKY